MRYIRWKTCAITQQISWLCPWGHAMASVSCLLNNLAVTNPPTRRPPTRIVALFRRAWHDVSFSIALVPFYIIDFVSHSVCQNWLPPSILVLDYSWIVSEFISVNSLPARTFWRSSFFFCFHLHVFHSIFLHQYPLSLSSFTHFFISLHLFHFIWVIPFPISDLYSLFFFSISHDLKNITHEGKNIILTTLTQDIQC